MLCSNHFFFGELTPRAAANGNRTPGGLLVIKLMLLVSIWQAIRDTFWGSTGQFLACTVCRSVDYPSVTRMNRDRRAIGAGGIHS